MGDGEHKERSKKTKGLRFVNEFIEFIESSNEDEVLVFQYISKCETELEPYSEPSQTSKMEFPA